MSKPKTVAEVIAGALEVFGPNGEHWNNYTLLDSAKDTYCSLGAIGKAGNNSAEGWDQGVAREAADLVMSCTPPRYRIYGAAGEDIPSWNDTHPAGKRGFRSIKAVFCKALKKAIDLEQPMPKHKIKAKVRKHG